MTTPTLQQYFTTLFLYLNLDWKLIYFLSRILTKNTCLKAFQYKFLNNELYLNHKLFPFKVSTTSFCFIVFSMMKLCNIFSAIAKNLFDYGDKSNFIL